MTPEPAQPAEAWLNDPASLESGEPAQPAESPEARVSVPVEPTEAMYEAAAQAWKGSLSTYWAREMWDAMLAASPPVTTFAASTARPTERGAVEEGANYIAETLRLIVKSKRVAGPLASRVVQSGHHLADLRAAALALPATDQAGEVEVCPGATWPDDWKRNGFNHAITQAQKALRYLAENDRPSGGEQFPNSASCHMIADELEVTRKRYAALATQTATGRTMGGEVSLPAEPPERVIRAMQGRAIFAKCTTNRGARDIYSSIVNALQNGGE